MTSRLRLTVMATHREEELRAAAAADARRRRPRRPGASTRSRRPRPDAATRRASRPRRTPRRSDQPSRRRPGSPGCSTSRREPDPARRLSRARALRGCFVTGTDTGRRQDRAGGRDRRRAARRAACAVRALKPVHHRPRRAGRSPTGRTITSCWPASPGCRPERGRPAPATAAGLAAPRRRAVGARRSTLPALPAGIRAARGRRRGAGRRGRRRAARAARPTGTTCASWRATSACRCVVAARPGSARSTTRC